MVFLGGTLYCCLVTVIGRHISKVYQRQQILWKTYIRTLICIALIVFCIVCKLQCPYMVNVHITIVILYITNCSWYKFKVCRTEQWFARKNLWFHGSLVAKPYYTGYCCYFSGKVMWFLIDPWKITKLFYPEQFTIYVGNCVMEWLWGQDLGIYSTTS